MAVRRRQRAAAAPIAQRLLVAMLLVLFAFASAASTDGIDRAPSPQIAKPLSASSSPSTLPASSAVPELAENAEREALAGLAESKRAAAGGALKEEEEEAEAEGGKASSALSTSSSSSPAPLLVADSSPPVVPDAGAAESAALIDAIREIEEEEAAAKEEEEEEEEKEERARAVASEPAPEAKEAAASASSAAAAAAAAPSSSRASRSSSSELDFDSSSLTPEERERKEAAAADLSLARARGDDAAAAVAFARLRDADAEKDSDEDEDGEEGEREREKKWRPFKMKDLSEEEEEEEERRESSKKESSSSPSPPSPPAFATTINTRQQQQEHPHIAPPFDPRWPSPSGVAFAALPGTTPQSLSLSSALPPDFDASVGGRGLPLASAKNRIQLTSFAAARAAREAARRADRLGREPEDLMAAENERPRPRRETMLTAGLVGVAKANAYGAKPDDIPVVSPLPLLVSEWKSSGNGGVAQPRDGKEASRVVIDRASSSPPFELTFAANAAVDQPTRRFRPPDQSLCVGNGVVITGNNLVLRTWDAETGAPLQGPIAQPDFFGLDGNFSDPVCIYDSQDSKKFFVGVFRFGEGATKYSQFVLSVSKTSNPADGFFGPYIFRNDGLDRDGKPLPGLDICGGDDDFEADSKRGVATENKNDKKAAADKKKKNSADDDDRDDDDRDDDGKDGDDRDKSDRAEASSPPPPPPSPPQKSPATKKRVSPGCLGDYPAVGLDANAFVATFNLFQTEPEEKYAGVLLLAIDKKGLTSGASSQPAFVAYSNFNAEISYTVQPSQTQAGTPHDPTRGGTLFLASTGPCTQNEPNVNMVAAWAMTNTSSLNSPNFGVKSATGGPSSWTIPAISKAALVEVPAYRDPGAFKVERLAMPQPEPGLPLDSGDARTLQLVSSGGVLWFSAQTAAHVGSPDSPLSVAVVYFALLPAWNDTASGEEERGGAGSGSLAAGAAAAGSSVLLSSKQQQSASSPPPLLPGALSNVHSASFSPRLVAAGYLAAPDGASLSRPAITATPDGTAWVSALLTGPRTHPTQVAARADLLAGPISLHASVLSPVVLGPTVPDKKFRGSASVGNAVNGAGNKTGSLRAGDYGGATLDEQGNVWLAGMWSGGVPSASCLAKFSAAKCPSWGTLVNKIKGGKADSSTAALTARAADRAASLGENGVVISAKGVAGPSVPGARAGEWAAKAKAAKAKKEKEEREEKEKERRESATTSVSALSPSSSSTAAAAAADLPPVVPSAAIYDPDDVPERVVVAGGAGSSGSGGR